MRESNKKSKSRLMFEAVFDQQTRRFSAFDLLGLSTEVPVSGDGENTTAAPPSVDRDRPADLEPRAEEPTEQGEQQTAHRTDGEPAEPQIVALNGLSLDLGTDRHTYILGSDENGKEAHQKPESTVTDQKPSEEDKVATAVGETLNHIAEDLVRSSVSSPDTFTPSLLGSEQTTQPSALFSHLRVDEEQRGGENNRPIYIEKITEKGKTLGPDGPVEDQTVDGLVEHVPDRLGLGQTVWSSLGQTLVKKKQKLLRPDRLAQAKKIDKNPVPIVLAPLQWKVWLALQEIDAPETVTSYRQIAKITKSTLDGVRKAIRAIEREGGIIAKETVRRAEEQGFRIQIDKNIAFRPGSINEAKGILKRGLHSVQTPDRKSLMLGPDGLCMYVCNNINIKQTDIARLLSATPASWKIREQTLTQIAELLPDMTAIEFRLSLVHLVEQAKGAKEPVRNPNAWVKAAFEKNGAPLVTERDIEARFGHVEQKRPEESSSPNSRPAVSNDEISLLRLYLGSSAEIRAEIDAIANQKAAPLLKVVTSEHQAGILEEARLEAVREFFGKRGGTVTR